MLGVHGRRAGRVWSGLNWPGSRTQRWRWCCGFRCWRNSWGGGETP